MRLRWLAIVSSVILVLFGPTGFPALGQGNPAAKAIIKSLTPQEREHFFSLSRPERRAFIQQRLRADQKSRQGSKQDGNRDGGQRRNRGGKKWQGTIIDAHSQFGCEIGASDIARVINRHGADYTLISARGCRGEDTQASHWRVLKLVESLPGRTGFLISTKLGGMVRNGSEFGDRGLTALYRGDQEYFGKSKGFAEIIVQHAPHDTGQLRRDGSEFDLESERIRKAIDLVIERNVPVTLHLELNDSENVSAKVLAQLKQLLRRHPDRNFVLIHMAQATVEEARDLLGNFSNIHFLTTAADAFPVIGNRRLASRGESAQSGWINLFNDPVEKAPYKGWLGDYLPTMRWRDDWKQLIAAYPDRFIFAMENVFGPHWTKRYPLSLKLWRKALALLPPEVAHQMACVNTKRLWRLDVACQR
jgi:Sec-independent protein translocase protein TatA